MKGEAMLTSSINCIEERTDPREVNANGGALTIRCYVYPLVATSPRSLLKPDRKLAFDAMSLLMRLDHELREVRADWNQDRFRRLMRLRPRVVARLRRRWEILHPRPSIPLGALRRRYHANLAGHRYESGY
jgi:hypothetical protein